MVRKRIKRRRKMRINGTSVKEGKRKKERGIQEKGMKEDG
jgi:hypothetical protein